MDNPKYIEALDECCDDPLMVEPLTWDTAIQDWAGTSQQLSERSDFNAGYKYGSFRQEIARLCQNYI